MQVSSIVPKSVGATVSDGERSFVQSTSVEPTSTRSPALKNSQPSVVKDSVAIPVLSTAKADDLSTNAKSSSLEQVNKALEKVNDAFVQKNQNLLATIEKDKETGINVLKVTDKDTKELVRQFPAEAVIAMAEVINQSLDAKGQFIHVKA